MKIRIVVGIVLLVIGFSYCYNNFLGHSSIVGKYVNRNYENHVVAEIPNVADTLTLFDNGQLESGFWGKGTYRITHGIDGTNIDWSYRNEFGKGGFNTSISRLNWGSPKIILVSDLNQYYEKLDY